MATDLTLPSSLRCSRCFLMIFSALSLLGSANMRECALKLPGTNRIDGRPLCITHEDVNQAFSDARQKVGLRTLALREVSDIMLDQLGTTLQETTRILATRFRLSGDELWEAVPEADVSRSEAAKRCPLWLRSEGGGGGGGGSACSATRFRRHDGSCNNLRHSTWGAARTPFKRLLPPEYADGISAPRLGVNRFPLPPARAVSSRVHRDSSREHEHNVTMMFVAWGQLIDHDLTLTAEAKEPVTRKDPDCCGQGPKHPNCLPANVPHDDPFYRKYNQRCISVLRSLAGARPDCRLGPRVQINSLTSYIDANFVYGSSFRKADSLRLLRGGLMRTSSPFQSHGLKPLLPPKTEQPDDGCIRHKPGVFCFYAGDNRVNEQLALGVLHTVFVRVHNQIATELSKINQHWDDEILYQETRHIVAAIVQHITYGEFLPLLLGQETIRQYGLNLKQEGYSNSYDPEVDASIPSSFATAAFRFGHSLLPSAMEKRSASHHIIGEKKLSEMLQQPYDLYRPGLVDQYLIGMVDQLAQAMDDSITEEVTNHLFQEPEKHFGKDLASINILRAREHGVPGFIKYKRLCGSEDIDDWSKMIYHFRNYTIDHYLDLYSDIEDIDLWSAGVAEVQKRGSLVGPTFNCIIAGTFRDVKRGDRFWYENDGWPSSFTPEQLSEIRKIKLSRLLCDAGDNVQNLQLRAMEISDYSLNPRVSCSSGLLPTLDLTHWKDYSSNKGPDEYFAENSVSLKPVETFFEDGNYFPSSSLSNSNGGNSFGALDSDSLIQEGTTWNESSSYSTFSGSPFPYRNPALQSQEVSHKKEPYKSWG